MAFKVSFSKTFEWPVEYSYVAETGGELMTVKFIAKFARDRAIIDKIQEKNEDGELKYTDDDACKFIVKGWKDVQDENGNDIPFSEEALADLLRQCTGLTQTFINKWSTSIQKAQEKNLKR